MGRLTIQLKYILSLLRFGFQEKPVLWLSMVLTFVTSGLDILSISMLYPLSQAAQHLPLNKNGFYVRHFGEKLLSIKFLLLTFLFLLALRITSNLINQGISVRAGKSLHAIVSSRIFGRVISDIPLSRLNSEGIGYFSSLAGDESFRASVTIINLSQFFNLFCITVTYYVAIAVFSIKAFVFITLFLLVCFLFMLTVFKRIHKLGVKQAELSRIGNHAFVDSVNNIKSIRCFNGEKLVLNNYSRIVFEYVGVLFQADFFQVFLRLVPVILLLIFVAVYIQINVARNQVLDIAYLIALFGFFSRLFPSLGLCLNTALKLISDSKSGKDVASFLKVEPSPSPNLARTQGIEIRDITFDNVTFGYDRQKRVLDRFTYHFSAGRSYVIIGPSGAGKSTLLDLLLKFYQADSGRIAVNGRPLDEFSDSDIRKRIILIEQRVTIFTESVLMNITLGAEASLEQVRKACKLAKIDTFIESLPKKYDSTIQYMGANLSGGQRQRIALARAILRDPDVLVLDESLSALDVGTKESIFADLMELFKNKILISVSHDPWIINKSDFVLDFGNLKT